MHGSINTLPISGDIYAILRPTIIAYFLIYTESMSLIKDYIVGESSTNISGVPTAARARNASDAWY